MFDLHPMRVLMMIPRCAAPTLQQKSSWSTSFHDFLAHCLRKDPEERPFAQDLLSHPFVTPRPNANAIVVDLIERARSSKRSRRSSRRSTNEDSDEPSVLSPSDSAYTEDEDDDNYEDGNEEYHTMKQDPGNGDSGNTIKKGSTVQSVRPITAQSSLSQPSSESVTKDIQTLSISAPSISENNNANTGTIRPYQQKNDGTVKAGGAPETQGSGAIRGKFPAENTSTNSTMYAKPASETAIHERSNHGTATGTMRANFVGDKSGTKSASELKGALGDKELLPPSESSQKASSEENTTKVLFSSVSPPLSTVAVQGTPSVDAEHQHPSTTSITSCATSMNASVSSGSPKSSIQSLTTSTPGLGGGLPTSTSQPFHSTYDLLPSTFLTVIE
jgi:hypothetical protein